MLYSPKNLLTSLTLGLAGKLRAAGYAVRWQSSGYVEAQTSGDDPLATVTLVKEAPATPESIVRLNEGETPQSHEVPVPAMTLHVVGPERKLRRCGLGETEFFWQRDVLIEGLASDEFEQAELEALFNQWYRGTIQLPVTDYSNEASPVVLAPAEVVKASVGVEEAETEIDAIRYYVFARLTLEYVE